MYLGYKLVYLKIKLRKRYLLFPPALINSDYLLTNQTFYSLKLYYINFSFNDYLIIISTLKVCAVVTLFIVQMLLILVSFYKINKQLC